MRCVGRFVSRSSLRSLFRSLFSMLDNGIEAKFQQWQWRLCVLLIRKSFTLRMFKMSSTNLSRWRLSLSVSLFARSIASLSLFARLLASAIVLSHICWHISVVHRLPLGCCLQVPLPRRVNTSCSGDDVSSSLARFLLDSRHCEFFAIECLITHFKQCATDRQADRHSRGDQVFVSKNLLYRQAVP